MNLWIHRFSQNTNEKLSGFLTCEVRAEILTFFFSYFGRNDDFINSIWNLLTRMSIPGLTQAILVLDKASTINKFKNHADLAFFPWPIVTFNFWGDCLLWHYVDLHVRSTCYFCSESINSKLKTIKSLLTFKSWTSNFILFQYLKDPIWCF